jgi:putative membrane protein
VAAEIIAGTAVAASAAEDLAAAGSAAAADLSEAAAPREAGDMLTADDHKQIADAIHTVEQKTAGDIYCIVAHESSQYREVPLAWGAALALIIPPLALLAGLAPGFFSDPLSSWSIASTAAQARELSYALSFYALAQGILFAAVALTASIPAVRRAVTPGFLKRHRTAQLARQHFVSSGLHLGHGQPHVLIYLSLMERRVEVLADEAVHRAAGEGVWKDASEAVTAGMRGDPTVGIVRAIEIAGASLIKHFPATRRDQAAEGVAEI